jgi:hypothetical protein
VNCEHRWLDSVTRSVDDSRIVSVCERCGKRLDQRFRRIGREFFKLPGKEEHRG